MNSAVKAVLLGFAVSGFAVGASAAGEGAVGKDWPSFRKADNDNNGAISMDEARGIGALGDSFAQYDKNSDGQLSRSEYESAKKAASKAGGAGEQTGSAGERKSQ